MKPPAKVVVGPHTYTVAHAAGMTDFGNTNTRTQRIILADDQSPGALRDTVLHEVLHCVVAHAGFSQEWEDREEGIVNRLTPVVLQVLRDNPRLVSYLIAKD